MAAPTLPAPDWRLGSTARHIPFDTSAETREPGREAPSAATLARRALIANGYASRAARPLAFSGHEQGARASPAPCAGQPPSQHADSRPEASARACGRNDDMQQLARKPLADSSNSAAPLSPPSKLSPRWQELDSAERFAKRKRLPATPVGCLQLLPTGSPAANMGSAATPVSAELPPRWRAPKRRSVCQPAEALTATAVPPGAMLMSVGSPLQRHGGTPAGAALQRGHVVSQLLERQVVPETPVHDSPAGSRVRAIRRADSRTGGIPLSSGLAARSDRGEALERLPPPLQPDFMDTSDAEQMLQAAAMCTSPHQGGRLIDVQPPAADLEPGVALAHSGSGHPASGSNAVDGRDVLLEDSCGSDIDLPVQESVVPETCLMPVACKPPELSPVAGIQAALPHAETDAGPHVRFTLPADLKGCPPPSADDSCVPSTQSPPRSPCNTQDSARRQSNAGEGQRGSASESFDPDRAIVPETLVWNAGCSDLAEAVGAAALQQPAGDSPQTCSMGAAAAVTAAEPPAESKGTPSCSQEPLLGFTAQLGEPVRCIMSSPDGRCPAN